MDPRSARILLGRDLESADVLDDMADERVKKLSQLVDIVAQCQGNVAEDFLLADTGPISANEGAVPKFAFVCGYKVLMVNNIGGSQNF